MDNELVRRKKIGGRAGKKKWKKQSDTSNLQLHDLKQARKQIIEDARPKSTSPKFMIQIEPDAAIKKKLDKDRFKDQNIREAVGKAEKNLFKKVEKQVKKIDDDSTEVEHEKEKSKSVPIKKPDDGQKKKDKDIEAEFDLWGADLVELDIHHKKPEIKTKNSIELPKVLKPYAGQSYNPSYQDHLELMKVVVNKAEEKRHSFKSKSDKADEKAKKQNLKKRPPQKPKTQKEKEMLEEHERQRELKRKEYEIKNFDRIMREEQNKQKKKCRLNLYSLLACSKEREGKENKRTTKNW